MTEPEKLNLTSHNLPADKTAELLRLFPEIRTEGDKIDFDKLKLVLGHTVDAGRERYGMNWPGKADCFKTIQAPSTGTLLPAPDESVNFDTTENLIIEGDNLNVLKLLQKSYLGKVKMIYIDPPYNTGNDFIYPDNYAESLQTYLEYTGQVDAEGRKFGTNADTDGRFHSRWMNMIYPRLYLARNLLSNDGVFFMSIDDSELDNAKKICNEIFSEANFLGMIVRATGTTTGQDSGGLGKSFDYILCYSKESDFELSGIPLDEEDEKRFNGEDAKGKFSLLQLRKTGSNDRRTDRPNMYFPIIDPDGSQVFPVGPGGYESCWRFDPKGYARLVSEDLIVWKKRQKEQGEEWWPYVKFYLEGRTKRPSPLWDDIDGNKKATIEIRDLLGEKVFSNPKPTELIERLLQIAVGESDNNIVLDFFAGSGTTAHAILKSNKNCNFILVQLPEPLTDDSKEQKIAYDYCLNNNLAPTVAEITKERVRRVVKKLNDEEAGQLPMGNAKQDRGFRVFKLSESNFKGWEASAPKDGAALVKQLEMHIDHIREGRTSEDILYEILLKSGFPLTTPVEKIEVEGKSAYSVAGGGMLICLEKDLTLETVRAMAELKPQRVICLDLGFANNDQLKANAVQIFKTKEIVFKTV